jgi:hypothetical protein
MTDALYGPAAEQMFQGPEEQGGPLLDVWAKIGVSLETVGAELTEQRRRQNLLWDAVHEVPVPTQQIAGNGTIDVPQLLGPSGGYWWDVTRLTAAGFSAGTVTVYKNAVADGNQLPSFPQAGVVTFGRRMLLGPKERLLFVTAGITLNPGAAGVSVGGDAIQVASWALPDYLL